MKLFEAFLLVNSILGQKNGRRTAEEAGSPLPADYNDERYYASNNKPNKKESFDSKFTIYAIFGQHSEVSVRNSWKNSELKTCKSHQIIITIIKITKLMAIHILWFNRLDQILSALTIIPHQELRSHFWVILRMEWSLQEKFDRSWPHSTFNVHGGSIFEL